MILTIDNLDGLGAVDYSACVDGSAPLEVSRTLNAPSILKAMLCLAGCNLKTPVRRGRVVLGSDAGAILFTGYLTTEPVAVYAGVASAGPVFRLALHAASDEWLLDKAAAGLGAAGAFEQTSASVLATLAQTSGRNVFVTSGVTSSSLVGVFVPAAVTSWSEATGALAQASNGSYRVLNGALTLQPVAGTVHALDDGAGTLAVSGLKLSQVRELSNDVTLSGAMEPTTYWTEIFSGDGTTAAFPLSGQPDAPSGGKATLLDDLFTGATFDRQTWQLTDPGSHLGLSAAGLSLNGGNGLDGQTTLQAVSAVELGGTITLELGNTVLNAGSAGVIGGLYSGQVMQVNCVAGFNVRQSGGNTLLVPLVNGAEAGTPFAVVAGHQYTLRLRLHCPELLRVKQRFYGRTANGAVAPFGGGLVDAPVAVVFEVRDVASSSNTPVTVLYDGAVASSPAQAWVVAADSVQLFGSIGSVELTRTGSGWVQTTDPTTGMVGTRLIGSSSQGVDCELTSSATGTVTFFAGRIPAPNEHVTVLYRGRARAVARLADAASIAAEAAGGASGTARWLGRVVQPATRSSEDCEIAALAVVNAASNRAAAIAGSYVTVNPPGGDIWPGDALQLTANGTSLSVIVRQVTLGTHGEAPEAITYRLAFANDWAESLGISLSEAIAADALLPLAALDLGPAPTDDDIPTVPAHVLANLQQMTVTAVSATAIQVDAGMDPPTGGGFEVRRRDGGFGTGLARGAGSAGNADLVLQSPVRGFTIPRATAEETFFVRMYDTSSPPLYSRVSSAIATHVPIG